MTITCQPARRNSRWVRLSLTALRCILAIQYVRLDAGTRQRAQPCICQKQPLTLIIFRNRGNTRSGVPGSERTCKRYRYPREWTSRRTASSGVVFFDLTAAMMRDRSLIRANSRKSLWDLYHDSILGTGSSDAAVVCIEQFSNSPAGRPLLIDSRRRRSPGNERIQ
jgi:hypothetical protein